MKKNKKSYWDLEPDGGDGHLRVYFAHRGKQYWCSVVLADVKRLPRERQVVKNAQGFLAVATKQEIQFFAELVKQSIPTEAAADILGRAFVAAHSPMEALTSLPGNWLPQTGAPGAHHVPCLAYARNEQGEGRPLIVCQDSETTVVVLDLLAVFAESPSETAPPVEAFSYRLDADRLVYDARDAMRMIYAWLDDASNGLDEKHIGINRTYLTKLFGVGERDWDGCNPLFLAGLLHGKIQDADTPQELAMCKAVLSAIYDQDSGEPSVATIGLYSYFAKRMRENLEPLFAALQARGKGGGLAALESLDVFSTVANCTCDALNLISIQATGHPIGIAPDVASAKLVVAALAEHEFGRPLDDHELTGERLLRVAQMIVELFESVTFRQPTFDVATVDAFLAAFRANASEMLRPGAAPNVH
jgi:hypothetical protein